ncbi:MAG: Fic family protein, partial [Acetobacteraceae bacterium]
FIPAVHDEQLAEHGGAIGVRDEGLLDSALARPLSRASYDGSDVPDLAALYAIAIARTHPFVAGNEPTAYVALEIFLLLNSRRFPVADAERR